MRALACVVSSMLLVGSALADDAPPRPTAPKTTAKIESQKSALAALLKQGTPNATIKTRHDPGPEGLTVIMAAIENAYPGSGVLRVLIDDAGTTYGVHGEKDFADLVRARKWLGDAPLPSADTLERLVDYCNFEGVAMWMDRPGPKVDRKKDALVLTLYRTWHPSGGKTRVEVTVRATGKAEIVSVNEK